MDNAEDRQILPKGWRIEVREYDDRLGLCVFSPDAGAFAVDGMANHKSDIRDAVIRALHEAMRLESVE